MRGGQQPGITVPPFHPNCRGTTAPAIDESIIGERTARNEDGEVYYVPADMTYTEWKEIFVNGGSKEGLALANAAVSGIIKKRTEDSGDIGVHYIGELDRDIYRCVTEDIVTDEVIITDKQIRHILERHPDAYDEIMGHMKDVIGDPDFIIEDKHPNTGLVIKQLQGIDDFTQLVLRICTSADEAGYKNSVISCWKISQKRLQNYLRNKKVLYKKE